MAKSKKPEVFEHLFKWRYDADGVRSERWDDEAGTIPNDRRVVYSNEVVRAIAETNASLGDNQAANFSKDFLRKESRNKNWPASLIAKRWTIKQQTGRDGTTQRARNFIWRPYADGQTEPFPDEWPTPENFERHSIQSVTISVASKQIARLDEPRLMQIVADLRIVETHFALYSPLSTDEFKVVHMDHLQMGLKLRGSEIDGLYLGEFQDLSGQPHHVLITVEAKKNDEFVNTSQVLSQIEHASALGVTCEKIVPIALKHSDGGVFVFEFAPFETIQNGFFGKDSLSESSLNRVAAVFYEVRPEVIGLSKRAKRPKTARLVEENANLDAEEGVDIDETTAAGDEEEDDC